MRSTWEVSSFKLGSEAAEATEWREEGQIGAAATSPAAII